jgi:hypothetical protein
LLGGLMDVGVQCALSSWLVRRIWGAVFVRD